MMGTSECFMCHKATSASSLSPISSSFRSRPKMNLFKELVLSTAFLAKLNATAPPDSRMSESSCRSWGQGEETDVCAACATELEQAWNWSKELAAIQLRVTDVVAKARQSVEENVLKSSGVINEGVDLSQPVCEELLMPELKQVLTDKMEAATVVEVQVQIEKENVPDQNQDDDVVILEVHHGDVECADNHVHMKMEQNVNEDFEVISTEDTPENSILKATLEGPCPTTIIKQENGENISSRRITFQSTMAKMEAWAMDDADSEGDDEVEEIASNFSIAEDSLISDDPDPLSLSDMLVPITQLTESEEGYTPTPRLTNPNPYVFISAPCRAAADAVLKIKSQRKPGGTGANGRFNPLIPLQDVYNCEQCSESGSNFSTTLRSYYLRHLCLHKKGIILPRQRFYSAIPQQDEYTCESCPERKFTDRKLYIYHLAYHKRCGNRSYLSKDQVRARLMKRSDIPLMDEYTCSHCSRVYKKRRDYICHLNYHKRMKNIYTFGGIKRKKRFQRRVPLKEEGNGQTYECEICNDGRVFSTESAHKSHMRYHEMLKKNGIDRPLRKQFEPKDSWKSKIPVQDEYQCEKCPTRSFTVRESYIGHLLYHKNLQRRGIDRVIPSRDEINSSSRNGGEEEEEEDEGPHICQICPNSNPEVEGPHRTFTNKRSYETHQKSHEKVRLAEGADRPLKPVSQKTPEKLSAIPHQDTYTCPTCPGRTFDTRNSYINHVRYHTILKKKRSDRAIISKEEFMQNPSAYKSPNVIRKCTICEDREFSNESRFKAHMTYHKRLKEINGGEERPILTASRSRRRKSKRIEIPVQDEYICRPCGNRVFTKRSSYIGHMQYHKKLKRQGVFRKIGGVKRAAEPKTCDICQDGRVFANGDTYKRHMRVHKTRQLMGEPDGPLKKKGRADIPMQDVYTCSECPEGKSFTVRSLYLQHLRYNHKTGVSTTITKSRCDIPIQDVYICAHPHCGKSFDIRGKYLMHLKHHRRQAKRSQNPVSSASSVRSNYCRICNKLFLNRASYTVHRKTHAKGKESAADATTAPEENGKTQNNCGYCPKSFATLEILDQHVNTVHAAEQVHLCPCGKCFTSKDAYEAHKLEGCSKRKLKCQACPKMFCSKASLELHTRTHTGEKPFQCDKCGRYFAVKMNLSRHEKKGKCSGVKELDIGGNLVQQSSIDIKYEQFYGSQEQDADQ